ncbi:MAG: serine/threonine protein kinase [Polyangiales bacterium]|jgi:serine/threonine protein kinase
MAPKPSKLCPICGLRYDAAAAFCQKDGARLTAEGTIDPFLGEILLGQFRIDEAIGAGGMGTVYRAHQMNLHRDVAVKILHPELTKNPDAVRRFHREAKVATSLEHPNLVRVFLFGELPDNGGLYLVMEHLEGRSLQELMRQEGALSLSRALHLSAQLCEAIGAAHIKGIVHRDVKPENIIVLPRHGDPDFVKVLDFGIARLLWDEQSHLTQSGVIFGTARYISPEGAAGEFTDARSDVYSIGVLIYQLMAGVTPFDAKSPVTMLMKHVNEAAPDLRTVGHGQLVPDPIADVIMRSLAKNPDARYDTASVFGEALAAAAEASAVILPRARYSLSPGDSMSAVPAVVSAPPANNTITGMNVAGLNTKRRWPVMLAAFAIGAAVMVGGVMAMNEFYSEAPEIAVARDLEARAREALAAGHFEAPPGDNVAELTLRILESQPRHEGALSIRREAASLLRERGTEARSQDDHDAAREAYRTALVFLPRDPAATQALEALEHEEEHEEPGLRLAPESASVGDRITFLGIVDHEDEIHGEARFEIHSRGRVLRSIEAVVVADHHYVGGYAFRTAGDYMVRFVAPLQEGEVSFDVELNIGRRGRVARRPPQNNPRTPMIVVVPREPVPNPWGSPQQGTVAPPNVQTMDNGNIDWSIPSSGMGTTMGTTMQDDGAPPPWTGEGNVI